MKSQKFELPNSKVHTPVDTAKVEGVPNSDESPAIPLGSQSLGMMVSCQTICFQWGGVLIQHSTSKFSIMKIFETQTSNGYFDQVLNVVKLSRYDRTSAYKDWSRWVSIGHNFLMLSF
jgi:hypothetical protein